jgi:hypothetical protein
MKVFSWEAAANASRICNLWMGLLLEVYSLDFEVVCLINHLLLFMELGDFHFISYSLEPDTEPSLIMHGNLLF